MPDHGQRMVRVCHRTTEAQCWVPPCNSIPLHCMAPPMWGAVPGKRRLLLSGMVVVSERVGTVVTYPVKLERWLSCPNASFLTWCIFAESGVQNGLGVGVNVVAAAAAVGLGSGCWFWSCFLLRKRPPDPLTLFKAWRCRDSWRYGCKIGFWWGESFAYFRIVMFRYSNTLTKSHKSLATSVEKSVILHNSFKKKNRKKS